MSSWTPPDSLLAVAADRELVLGVLDPLLEHPAVGSRLAALDAFEFGLRLLELATRELVVDLAREHRVVDQRDRAVLLDLEEARAGCVLADFIADVHACRACLQRRDQRRVTCEHADL